MPRSPAGCSKRIKELNEALAVLWGPAENEEGEIHESNSPPKGRGIVLYRCMVGNFVFCCFERRLIIATTQFTQSRILHNSQLLTLHLAELRWSSSFLHFLRSYTLMLLFSYTFTLIPLFYRFYRFYRLYRFY